MSYLNRGPFGGISYTGCWVLGHAIRAGILWEDNAPESDKYALHTNRNPDYFGACAALDIRGQRRITPCLKKLVRHIERCEVVGYLCWAVSSVGVFRNQSVGL